MLARRPRRGGVFGSTSEIMGENLGYDNNEQTALSILANNKTVVVQKPTIERIVKAKKVIYTCITGGYDVLNDPIKKYGDYDYICFTDNPNQTSTFWEIRPIPEELLNLEKAKQQRLIKICPHKYLSEYDMSIWVDGNTLLNFDFTSYINTFVDDKNSVYVKKHPVRVCAYQEMLACERMKKDDPIRMKAQMERYKQEGFPKNFGLPETNFMVRFHNEENCKTLMDAWSEEIINGSKRDQLSFSYCVWKTKATIKYFTTNRLLVPKSHSRGRQQQVSKVLKPRTNDNEVKICVINYNTNLLMNHLIKSIRKFVPKHHIYVFDNSDKEKFESNDSDVTIFDNTNGQIINFNTFLAKYPKRFSSNGRRNQFGSAKHCISIDKCMDLINDNFILLDSDVLLKKDISQLYNDAYMYIAETTTQANSSIKRILPFICFINVKKCKQNNIRYFNDNYMHGLRKTASADRYDTGAYFYIVANKFEHFDINDANYIEHMKGGSWREHTMTPQAWLNKNKKYWE